MYVYFERIRKVALLKFWPVDNFSVRTEYVKWADLCIAVANQNMEKNRVNEKNEWKIAHLDTCWVGRGDAAVRRALVRLEIPLSIDT